MCAGARTLQRLYPAERLPRPRAVRLREGAGPASCFIPSPRPRPSRFPAELGCSLNFQRWFDFLQRYHTLLCKQSTWSGQTKEHVCCKPAPYHGSASSARRGPGPRCHFSLQSKHPVSPPEAAGAGAGGGLREGACLSASSAAALEICSRARTARPGFPAAAKISFHLR